MCVCFYVWLSLWFLWLTFVFPLSISRRLFCTRASFVSVIVDGTLRISFSVASKTLNGCAYHSTFKMRLCKHQGGHTNKSLYFLFMFLLMAVAFLCFSTANVRWPCLQLYRRIFFEPTTSTNMRRAIYRAYSVCHTHSIHIGSCVHKIMCSH